ncbi:serine/threonine protein phosphatase [Defluviicoccus vanus]|uniref:Serine/threonine protein phosphatase n=2 Tax=Defluviicoccus vanus TaxID=111831 RepID=A0A7H1N0M0_9PROT|nr:serine/threonine protein phosphatase [Defluviicoccus vanus]
MPLHLLKRLWQRSPQIGVGTASVPPGMRIYAIGDIHGRFDLLRQLHQAIRADCADVSPLTTLQVVYLGDYVDRGWQSREVIDLLIEQPLRGFFAVHLLGNHDRQLLEFLQHGTGGPQWLRYGGDATICSYGVRMTDGGGAAKRLTVMRDELVRTVPQQHVRFLQQLPLMHQVGDYLFVHAGIDPEKPLAEQTERDLLWIRDEFLESDNHFGAVVVHGHTTTREPDVRSNRIGIDTGACYGNRLTCLVLEGQQKRFLTATAARPSSGFAVPDFPV